MGRCVIVTTFLVALIELQWNKPRHTESCQLVTLHSSLYGCFITVEV